MNTFDITYCVNASCTVEQPINTVDNIEWSHIKSELAMAVSRYTNPSYLQATLTNNDIWTTLDSSHRNTNFADAAGSMVDVTIHSSVYSGHLISTTALKSLLMQYPTLKTTIDNRFVKFAIQVTGEDHHTGINDNTELVGAVDAHIAGDGKEFIVKNTVSNAYLEAVQARFECEMGRMHDPMSNCDKERSDEEAFLCVDAWSNAYECVHTVGEDEHETVCADLIAAHHAACNTTKIDPIVARCLGYMADLVNPDTAAYFADMPEHLPYGISRFDGGIEFTWAWMTDAGDYDSIYHAGWMFDFQAALRQEGHSVIIRGSTLYINCPEQGDGKLGTELARIREGHAPLQIGHDLWHQDTIN